MNDLEMKVKCLELAQAFFIRMKEVGDLRVTANEGTPQEIIERADFYYRYLMNIRQG
jgi:uncharacterized protein YjfI (DUF2170 family)